MPETIYRTTRPRYREPAMGERGYTFFDHTGDTGVDVRAPTREAVVAASARAFLDVLTDAPNGVAEAGEREVRVEGFDAPTTLVALLNELLWLFESEGFLCARFAPTVVSETEIAGVAHGERYDPARHEIARPVKAVTHHQAAFTADADGARARLVFDL